MKTSVVLFSSLLLVSGAVVAQQSLLNQATDVLNDVQQAQQVQQGLNNLADPSLTPAAPVTDLSVPGSTLISPNTNGVTPGSILPTPDTAYPAAGTLPAGMGLAQPTMPGVNGANQLTPPTSGSLVDQVEQNVEGQVKQKVLEKSLELMQ